MNLYQHELARIKKKDPQKKIGNIRGKKENKSIKNNNNWGRDKSQNWWTKNRDVIEKRAENKEHHRKKTKKTVQRRGKLKINEKKRNEEHSWKIEKRTSLKEKDKKTSHLVEVVVDAMIICRRLWAASKAL